MSYSSWFSLHAKKHHKIVSRLKHLRDDEVIAYFRYSNMVEQEPGFCPLYAKNEQCHEMEKLNCYLCACPNFRFDDDGIAKEGKRVLYSHCSIDAKEGEKYIDMDSIHHDCSKCTIPHKEHYIKEHFSRNWMKIMAHSNQSSS